MLDPLLEKRDTVINVRVTKRFKIHLEKQAKQNGLPVSRLITKILTKELGYKKES